MNTNLKDQIKELSTPEQYKLAVELLLGIADTTYLTIQTAEDDVHQAIVKNVDGEIEWVGFIE